MIFTEFEANFLKLLDILTDGSRIEVNESGNILYDMVKMKYCYM